MSSRSSTTPAVEDYVKAIWLVVERGESATGQAIAAQLGVSQASVSAMVRKLADLDLARVEPYKPVVLTDRGHAVALEMVRHHRLLELFLVETLGMSWDRIHAEAEVLEHHISEELEELICHKLGNPQFDPHGHPIPTRDGRMPTLDVTPVARLTAGASATVRQVRDETPDVLRFLEAHGIIPGARVQVDQQEPLAGTTTLRVAGAGDVVTIGSELARHIDVDNTPS